MRDSVSNFLVCWQTNSLFEAFMYVFWRMKATKKNVDNMQGDLLDYYTIQEYCYFYYEGNP